MAQADTCSNMVQEVGLCTTVPPLRHSACRPMCTNKGWTKRTLALKREQGTPSAAWRGLWGRAAWGRSYVTAIRLSRPRAWYHIGEFEDG